MGFLEAQLAQGYALTVAQRVGLLDQEDQDQINTVMSVLQATEHFLGAELPAWRKRKFDPARPVKEGSYKSKNAAEIGSRIQADFKSYGRPTFAVMRPFRTHRSHRSRSRSEYHSHTRRTTASQRRSRGTALRRGEAAGMRRFARFALRYGKFLL